MADNKEIGKEKETMSRSNSERRAERALRDLIDIDNEQRSRITWRSVLGGDVLAGGFFRRYVFFILLMVVLLVVYVSNRYACQQEFIEQTHLLDTLQDRRWKLLTITSEIKEKTRRSFVEDHLGDSTLGTSTQPLYQLEVEE
ncbi:MAG: hypothetical protein IJS89_02185 [Bacteroidaceae bacterium]|nr:hypothetical protein [Bacteroidaceae bacterium]